MSVAHQQVLNNKLCKSKQFNEVAINVVEFLEKGGRGGGGGGGWEEGDGKLHYKI